MTENPSANKECFGLYKEIFGNTDIFSCKHPVENEEIEDLYLLYDLRHLLKYIRNNWQTENAKTKIY